MAIRRIQERATENLFTNTEISGTEAAKMPVGTTAQRANVQAGDIRFNSTLSLMEYYDGSQWKSIDSPPTVSSVSPDNFDTAGDTITITGTNLQSGLTVKLVAEDGSEFSASSVTYTNSTTASFDITAAMVADDNDPYDVMVTNASGLSGTLANALDFAPEPVFATAAATYTVYDAGRANFTLDASATSSESDATLSYAVTTGSLPSGGTLNTSTGAITSLAAVGSDTASTFTITATATDGTGNTTTNTRSWTINVKAPVITSYTSTGSGTFSVPSGVTVADVLVVAGGGTSGVDNGGGGGAGGLIYRPAFPVTPGGSVSYSVGAGGSSPTGPHPNNTPSSGQGQNSTFGTLTAQGGGRGGSWNGSSIKGFDGGSGGGGSRYSNQYQGGQVGQGTQPQQPGDDGTYGFGSDGGIGSLSNPHPTGGSGGGGGGAGGNGAQGDANSAGNGGAGKSYSIGGSSVTYAWGGGGGSQQLSNGNQGNGTPGSGTNGVQGTANRGAGGGAGSGGGPEVPGYGGSGIVIVSY